MKIIAFALCALCLLHARAAAQQPGQPPRPNQQAPSLPENYVVTLTVTGKDQMVSTLSLVVASADFKTDFLDSKFNVSTFFGTIIPEEGGSLSIRYTLGGQIAVPVLANHDSSVQLKTMSTQASVRLNLGETVQILKSAAYVCTLNISRLSDAQASGK